MNTFHRTAAFDSWLSTLKDGIGKARIAQRIRAAELGHFGDTKPVGEGVSEMRIHAGPDTACITCESEAWSICCSPVATKPANGTTSSRRWTWRAH